MRLLLLILTMMLAFGTLPSAASAEPSASAMMMQVEPMLPRADDCCVDCPDIGNCRVVCGAEIVPIAPIFRECAASALNPTTKPTFLMAASSGPQPPPPRSES